MEDLNNISRLIADSILNKLLSETEQRQLDAWLQTSEANRQLYSRIKELHATQQILKLEKEGYGKKMAERFRKEVTPPLKIRNRRTTLYVWLGSAAVVLVFFFSFSFLRHNKQQKTSTPKTASVAIRPGKTGAVLTLANGASIHLGQNDKKVERLIDSVYTKERKEHREQSEKTEYHTLSIPAGKEFFCQLDDNTSVWLNSQTELRFPKKFGKHERKVYLEGEAFFDVSKDSKRPFIVSMKQGNIKVYGTRFNIANYANSPLSAVLVEGSIGFTTPQGIETKISPSEKLTYEQEKQNISICTVDTSIYTAWVNHIFIFNGQPLEEIMTTLSRWYNFSVSFASEEIRHIRLSGQLYRHEDIRVLLNSYEATTGLRFNIEGRTILITK